MIGVELFVEIKYLDRQGLQQDYVVRYQPCHVQAMTTMASCLQFLTKVLNVLFPGPSRIRKTHLSIALGYEAVKAGYKVLSITTQELTSQLYASFADATFQRELERLDKYLSLYKTASSHFF